MNGPKNEEYFMEGMKMKQSNLAIAACAETELAKFPVDAHDTVSNPNSTALLVAIETTRSLNDNVGRHTVSSLI